jgi:GntR family phosphonate transport system transcriptional regulator
MKMNRSQPLWCVIEAQIAGAIGRGRYRPGQRLETEHALAARFCVNRHTVRQAIGSLAAKGVLRVEQGRGTFVADFGVEYLLGRRTRFSENVAAAGFSGRHRLVEWDEGPAPTAVAARLGLRPRARVLRVVAVGDARGRPIAAGEHFFPAPRFRGLAEIVGCTGSFTRALAGLGVADYARQRSVVTARLPDARTARLLGQPTGRPVLFVEGLNVDSGGRPIELARTYFAGDFVQLVVEPDA